MSSNNTTDAAGQSLQRRMARLVVMDRIWGWSFTVILWVVYLFTFFQVAPVIDSGLVVIVAAIGGALVLLYATASVIAMIRQFGHHVYPVYEPDIRHLDERRARKRARRRGA